MERKIVLVVLVLVVVAIDLVSAKGSRGGSRSYSSRSYTSGSYSSYRATSVRSWSTVQKSRAAMIGAIFISMRMRSRYGSGSGWNDDMNVCRNSIKYPSYNGSTTQYGWFLCPTDEVSQDKSHCCGDDGEEYCCEFWSSATGIGAIVGIVLFVLIGIGALCVAIWYFLKKSTVKRLAPAEFSGGAVMYSNSTETVTTKTDSLPPSYASAQVQNTPYPLQPSQYPPVDTAYPPMPTTPPPAYPEAGAMAPASYDPPAAYGKSS